MEEIVKYKAGGKCIYVKEETSYNVDLSGVKYHLLQLTKCQKNGIQKCEFQMDW